MIIEYIGSLIRNEVANKRERIYENSVSIDYMLQDPLHYCITLIYQSKYVSCLLLLGTESCLQNIFIVTDS